MITAKASAALDWLFEKAIRDNSVLAGGESCTVSRKAEVAAPAEDSQRQLVVLNMSSYLFRIVALFDFDSAAAATAHLARQTMSGDRALEGQARFDACAEFVNMVCGAVNRGLCTAFQHAGMSTPFQLESSCARYLSVLTPSRVQCFEVAVDDGMRFNVTVCVCLAAGTTLDFDVDRSEPEVAAGGELELF
jgi:hypothetical protein